MPIEIRELTLQETTYPPKSLYLSGSQTLALVHHMIVVFGEDFFLNVATCAHFLHFVDLSTNRSIFALFQPNPLS